MTRLALVGARIYCNPSDAPISDGAIVVDDTKIASVGAPQDTRIPEDTKVLDCSGCTIVAGFWNCHVHFFERKWIQAAWIPAEELGGQLKDAFTRYGFTTVFDLGSQYQNTRTIRDRIEAGKVDGPRIFSTGEALLPPNALPSDDVLRVMGFANFPAPEITDPTSARDATRNLVDAGVDGIKIFASSPRSRSLTQETVAATVDEAHGAQKRVFIHPNEGDDVLDALQAGVDVIAHTTPFSGPWDETIMAEVRSRNTALTPTLNLWRYYLRHDRQMMQENIMLIALGQLRRWHERNGTVLFGTDLGAVDPDPMEEYRLMLEAGLSFADVLASLTTTPADFFGDSNGGSIAKGKRADLTVLNGDPAQNTSALANVRYTVRSGKVIYSAA